MESDHRMEVSDRGIDECLGVLEENDPRTRQRRAERLSAIPVITTYWDYNNLPALAAELLTESTECFVAGCYKGALATLAMATEHALRERLRESTDALLAELIFKASKDKLLTREEVRLLRSLLVYRNKTFHSDLAGLARIHWPNESIRPEQDSIDEQIRTRAVTQARVAELVVQVRTLLYRLFDGVEVDTRVAR